MSALTKCIFCEEEANILKLIRFKEKTLDKCRIIYAAREIRHLAENDPNFNDVDCDVIGYHGLCYKRYTSYKMKNCLA